MANYGWTNDSGSGVLKNNKLSAKIRDAAVVQSVGAQFIDMEPGYGRGNGESITVTRISNVTVPTSALLTEGQPISEDTFSISSQAITVAENGRAIPFTSLAKDLSTFDVSSKIQRKLMQQMKISMDRAIFTAGKTGQIKAIPDGIASLTMDTDGTASTAGTVNYNSYHAGQIRDYLFSTLNVEPMPGDYYIGAVSTKAKRGLMADPDFSEWNKQNDARKKFKSELGEWENIVHVEVPDTNCLSASKGTGSVQGEALFFGMDFISMAVAVDPELRVKVPTDYGRSLGVAWYGIYGYEQIWDDSANAGEARCVHFTSS